MPVTFSTASYTPDSYWTNQATLPECRPNASLGGHVSCGPPVAKLHAGGVLVVVIDLPEPSSPFRANTRIAGHPAHVAAADCTTNCPAQATRSVTAVIRVPGHPSRDLIKTLQLQAFFGATAIHEVQSYRRMLHRATST